MERVKSDIAIFFKEKGARGKRIFFRTLIKTASENPFHDIPRRVAGWIRK
jgi:hypothetical protein